MGHSHATRGFNYHVMYYLHVHWYACVPAFQSHLTGGVKSACKQNLKWKEKRTNPLNIVVRKSFNDKLDLDRS